MRPRRILPVDILQSLIQNADWNKIKTKNQLSKDQKDKTIDLKDAFKKPHWNKSKSSTRSSPKSNLNQKSGTKSEQNSSSSVNKQQVKTPIKTVKQSVLRPIYKWVPAMSCLKSPKVKCNTSVCSSNSNGSNNSVKLPDNLDIFWDKFECVKGHNTPSKKHWVSKSN